MSGRTLRSRLAAVAACLVMVLGGGTYSYQNLMVYATVTLEGTTPVQLELNRHDKVIGVKAVDESGEDLKEMLLKSGIKGETLENAVARAEHIMRAHNDSKKVAEGTVSKPKVECKSSDKIKALKDKIRAGQKSAVESEKTSKAETTAPQTTSQPSPDKSAEVTKPTQSADSASQGSGSSDTVTTTKPPAAEPAPQKESEPTEAKTELDGGGQPEVVKEEPTVVESHDSEGSHLVEKAVAADPTEESNTPAPNADDED